MQYLNYNNIIRNYKQILQNRINQLTACKNYTSY